MQQSLPVFNIRLLFSLLKFWFVTIVPRYSNCATFSKDLLPTNLIGKTDLINRKLYYLKKNPVFRDVTPTQPFKFGRHFEGMFRLHLQGIRMQAEICISYLLHDDFLLAYSTTLNLLVEVAFSSKISVEFQQPTRRYIPKDRDLSNRVYCIIKICIKKYTDEEQTLSLNIILLP
jgi:hypothetical protein